MIKSASVALIISSTETPGALSKSLKPFGVISKTANSVTTFFTQPTPVKGSVQFFKILLSEDREFSREEIIRLLHTKYGMGNDLGHAGRYFSNISQFITRVYHGHVRQILKFDAEEGSGKIKNNFYLLQDYRDLISKILKELDTQDSKSEV